MEFITGRKEVINFTFNGYERSIRLRPKLYHLEHFFTTSTIAESSKYQVYLCSVVPREDVDVRTLDEIIQDVTDDVDIKVFHCYNSFVHGDGRPAGYCFTRDGIQLSTSGSKTLVHTINQVIWIIKERKHSGELAVRSTPRNVNHGRNQTANLYRHINGVHRQTNRRPCTLDDFQTVRQRRRHSAWGAYTGTLGKY